LVVRAQALYEELWAINTRLFQRLRSTLSAANTTPEQRLRILRSYIPQNPRSLNSGDYDALDVLVNSILYLDQDGEPEAILGDPEMIRYQPTPARVILELIEQGQIGSSDIFYDLGSGRGHVAILIALLTGARVVGVEIDHGLCTAAQQSIRRLALPTATILCSDAREADLAAGTIFYMYTPFTGMILATVLERLRLIAMQHPIRLCTYGPYLAAVTSQPWLTRMAMPGNAPTTMNVYTSQ
jgi:SAM-dependent methyltransferase